MVTESSRLINLVLEEYNVILLGHYIRLNKEDNALAKQYAEKALELSHRVGYQAAFGFLLLADAADNLMIHSKHPTPQGASFDVPRRGEVCGADRPEYWNNGMME